MEGRHFPPIKNEKTRDFTLLYSSENPLTKLVIFDNLIQFLNCIEPQIRGARDNYLLKKIWTFFQINNIFQKNT